MEKELTSIYQNLSKQAVAYVGNLNSDFLSLVTKICTFNIKLSKSALKKLQTYHEIENYKCF